MEKDLKKLEQELKQLLTHMDESSISLLYQEAKAVSFDCPGFTLLGIIQRAVLDALEGGEK